MALSNRQLKTVINFSTTSNVAVADEAVITGKKTLSRRRTEEI
jgi:hypothetical protein